VREPGEKGAAGEGEGVAEGPRVAGVVVEAVLLGVPLAVREGVGALAV
jgi:hypothetical protein